MAEIIYVCVLNVILCVHVYTLSLTFLQTQGF